MNPRQLRELIEHVLKDAGLYSPAAVELLLLTAAVESNLGEYIKQVGGGPARGIFQMEPSTEKDLYDNYLQYRGNRWRTMARYNSADTRDLWFNLGYQILLARMHYMRVPEALPDPNDILAMAKYWKKYYNTWKGAGTVDKARLKYLTYVKNVS